MTSIRDLDTEEKCRKLVEEMVLGTERKCPTCQGLLHTAEKYLWCRVCRKKIYVKAGTWLKGSKLSYRDMFLLVIGWITNAPPGAVKNLTGISYTTSERWYTRFRERLPRDTHLLNGTLEIDESFWGRRKHQKQEIVIGLIDRVKHHLRLEIIPDREQHSLEIFLVKTAHPESMIHSDCNPGYYDIGWYGYGSTLHNHSKGHFAGTNQAENIWSVSKRQMIRLYTRIQNTKLPELLIEWEARRNFPHLFQCPVQYLKFTLVPS